jgi:hypothetical protein
LCGNQLLRHANNLYGEVFMALAATITGDPRRGLTSINPLIYGQFLE